MSVKHGGKHDKKPRRINGRWAPGVSGNPRGRPRTGMALAERVRATVDMEEMIAVAVSIYKGNGVAVRSDTDAAGAQCVSIPSARDRLAALTWLRDTGFFKPAQLIATADLTPSDDSALNYEALPDDVLDDYLRAQNRAAVALGLPDLIDDMVVDEPDYIDVGDDDDS